MIRRFAAVVGALVMVVAGTTTTLADSAGAQDTVHRVTGAGYLGGIGCESTVTCFAVGVDASLSAGSIATLTNGIPGAATTVSSVGQLNDIACWSSQRCVAVGDNTPETEGAVVPVTGGSPGSAVAIAGAGELSSVACMPSPSTTCYATGQSATNGEGVLLAMVNGVPGKAMPVKGSTTLNDITCASTTTCYASGVHSDGIAVVVTINNGAVSAVTPVPAASRAVWRRMHERFAVLCRRSKE